MVGIICILIFVFWLCWYGLTSSTPRPLPRSLSAQLFGFAYTTAVDSKHRSLLPYCAMLGQYTAKWLYLTARIGMTASSDRESVGVSSTDYLMYSGYVSMAFNWLRMMKVANERLADPNSPDRDFYQAKLQTGEFYFRKMLPR